MKKLTIVGAFLSIHNIGIERKDTLRKALLAHLPVADVSGSADPKGFLSGYNIWSL
ncbi:MAG TPA: hypothetical protein VGK10_17880 [Prolixibacteraceae bacterium]|jgi:hypothetical protein